MIKIFHNNFLSALCTSTSDSSIFSVDTVVSSNWTSRTAKERGLSSTAIHIIQPNHTISIGEATCKGSNSCTIKTQNLM